MFVILLESRMECHQKKSGAHIVYCLATTRASTLTHNGSLGFHPLEHRRMNLATIQHGDDHMSEEPNHSDSIQELPFDSTGGKVPWLVPHRWKLGRSGNPAGYLIYRPPPRDQLNRTLFNCASIGWNKSID
jgi:hypothetical protein